jgi:hypothetical protein
MLELCTLRLFTLNNGKFLADKLIEKKSKILFGFWYMSERERRIIVGPPEKLLLGL